MNKYIQDFGFYCRNDSISLVAGKVLKALEYNQTETISEIPRNNTLSPENAGKNKESSTPLLPSVLAEGGIGQDHIQSFMTLPSFPEDLQKQRSRPPLLNDTSSENVEGHSSANHTLKCYSCQNPKSCVLEHNKGTRRLLGKKNQIAKSDDMNILNIWSMSLEQQCTLFQDTNQTKAVLLTMVFQNGSSSLCPSKDPSMAMNGIVILIKRQSEHYTSDPGIYDKEDIYVFIDMTDNSLIQYKQAHDHFFRKVFPAIFRRKSPVICMNAKDFLRTIVRFYGKIINWKKASRSAILDPSIAAWLLNPVDCNPTFDDLVKKYCEGLNLRTTGDYTQHQIIGKRLEILYHLMETLKHKLQSEKLWDLFYNIELPLTSILAVMENTTIKVNEEELKRTSKLLGVHLKELEKEAHHVAGEKFRLTSSNELRQVLYEKLQLHMQCKNKIPLTNMGHLPSTAELALLQLKDLHPLPGIILQFRQVQKIKSTFVDGLSSYISKGCVSPTWNQTGTVSGRLSAKHPNIQGVSKFSVQFEKRQCVEGKAKEIVTINPRSMFISAQGFTFLAADFSQIELRLLAHFSSDSELLRLFNDMETTDVFTNLASQWKNVEYKYITQADREQAKRVVYSVIYGVGKERLSECLGTTQAEANAFMERFLQKYKVSHFTQGVIEQCHLKGYVVSLMGRKRPLPHINSKNYSLRAQAERQAVNFVIQGSAADLCKLAMITISEAITVSSHLTSRLIAQIHDELLFEVEDSQIQEFAALVKHIMESLQHTEGVDLKVPLKVALSSGKSWGCMTELQVK